VGFWEEEARGEDAAAVDWAGGEGRGRGEGGEEGGGSCAGGGEGAMFVDDGVRPGCCYRSFTGKGGGRRRASAGLHAWLEGGYPEKEEYGWLVADIDPSIDPRHWV